MGEASARARPENSLLEEDLDFEHVQKVTPVITEETVRTLEELIKKRILDVSPADSPLESHDSIALARTHPSQNDFNSTVRVRAYDPTPFLPSRFFDLQDTQSNKSLAQIYEEEYQSAASGSKTVDPRDDKLKKDHQEIEDLWGEICYKLDALSSLNFVPKQVGHLLIRAKPQGAFGTRDVCTDDVLSQKLRSRQSRTCQPHPWRPHSQQPHPHQPCWLLRNYINHAPPPSSLDQNLLPKRPSEHGRRRGSLKSKSESIWARWPNCMVPKRPVPARAARRVRKNVRCKVLSSPERVSPWWAKAIRRLVNLERGIVQMAKKLGRMGSG